MPRFAVPLALRIRRANSEVQNGVNPMIRQFSVATLAVICLVGVSAQANAQFPQGNYQSPLFSQYTTQGAGDASAAMYPAPHYSPMLGAQSYYTYQPLMPHEMMYQHSRNYYNYYNTGGFYGGNALNKTSVRWQAGNNHMGPLPFSTGLSGLSYRVNSRRYCIGDDCNGGGRTRRIGHGGFGCLNGNCGSASEVMAGDAYGGDAFYGEAPAAGCATGSCAANISDEPTRR